MAKVIEKPPNIHKAITLYQTVQSAWRNWLWGGSNQFHPDPGGVDQLLTLYTIPVRLIKAMSALWTSNQTLPQWVLNSIKVTFFPTCQPVFMMLIVLGRYRSESRWLGNIAVCAGFMALLTSRYITYMHIRKAGGNRVNHLLRWARNLSRSLDAALCLRSLWGPSGVSSLTYSPLPKKDSSDDSHDNLFLRWLACRLNEAWNTWKSIAGAKGGRMWHFFFFFFSE